MKESAKYLIIGGGIAGTSAAETIRRYDKDGSIVIVSDEPCRLYSRIMLSKPNFFLGKIPFEHMWLKRESWYEENKIRLMLGKTAVKLDISQKMVALDDGRILEYEKLLLAAQGEKRSSARGGSASGGNGLAGRSLQLAMPVTLRSLPRTNAACQAGL